MRWMFSSFFPYLSSLFGIGKTKEHSWWILSSLYPFESHRKWIIFFYCWKLLWILDSSFFFVEVDYAIWIHNYWYKGDNFVDWLIFWLTVEYIFRAIRIVVTDPNTEDRGCDCLAGLECLINIIRALRMGSCLSAESRNPHPGSPSAVIRKRKTTKKRPASRNSSFDYKREEMLHRIQGRMFLNGSSEVASLFTQQGRKGTNQDAMIVWEVNFLLFCKFILKRFHTWI